MIQLPDKIGLFRHIFEKLTPPEKANWEEKFAIEYTHNSTAIEGNTLSLIETKMILEDGIAPNEKSLREIDEIRNHHKAFQYVKAQTLAQNPITENTIKDIHQRVLPVDGIGGLYRTIPVYIRGAEHIPPNYEKVRELMKFFVADLQAKGEASPIERAAWLHAEFVKIHPFQDGNGRTARLLMNYSLMLDKYPPTIIKKGNVQEYFQSLETYAMTGNLAPFSELLEKNLNRELTEFNEMYKHHINLKELNLKRGVLRCAESVLGLGRER